MSDEFLAASRWIHAQNPPGQYRIRILAHDEASRLLQLVCEPSRADLDRIIVNIDYSDRLSLFCDDEAYENLSAAASKYCYESKPRTMEEVLTFLSTKLGLIATATTSSGPDVVAVDSGDDDNDGFEYDSDASYHYDEEQEPDDGVIGVMDSAPLKLQKSASCFVFDEEALLRSQTEVINSVARTFGMSVSNSSMLLRHCKWDAELLENEMRKDATALLRAAGIASLKDAAPEFAAGEGAMCDVCLDDLPPPPSSYALSCGHWFCANCWAGLVAAAVEKGKVAIFTAKCPEEGCPLLVGDDVFRRFLKPDGLELYDRIMLLSFIEDCANLVRCPSPHCSHVIGVSKKKRNVRCECGFSFCFRCQGEAHAPATCDQLRDWQQREEKVKKVHEIERASKKAGKSTAEDDGLKVKPCPNPACRIPTTKISGCMYLNCTKCGNPWCWQCGQWGPQTHHVFQCNAAPAEGWGELSESAMAGEDGKFNFYYERYLNHMDSLKMAQQQLDKAIAVSTQIEEERGMFLGDFIVSAVNLLIRCRQTLCWTYVFGYYIKDNAVRKLFEFSQGQLETYTEKFSQMTEQPPRVVMDTRDAITRWTQALKQYLENMEDYETIADAMVAVAAVAPPKKWWFSLSGAWLPHDEDTCQRLDAAAASGIERFEITIGGELYVVDLKRGTQKRLDRGIESSLRHGNGHFVDGAGAQLVRAATVQKPADGAPGRPHAFPALAGGAKRNVKRRR